MEGVQFVLEVGVRGYQWSFMTDKEGGRGRRLSKVGLYELRDKDNSRAWGQ